MNLTSIVLSTTLSYESTANLKPTNACSALLSDVFACARTSLFMSARGRSILQANQRSTSSKAHTFISKAPFVLGKFKSVPVISET